MPEAKDRFGDVHRGSRLTYVKALAVGLGVDQKFASEFANSLLSSTTSVSGTDYKKNREELNPEAIQYIESLGRSFLKDTGKESLAFTVGARLLALAKEDPKSGYFTNLEDWVNLWTDGDGGVRFRKTLGWKTRIAQFISR